MWILANGLMALGIGEWDAFLVRFALWQMS
jgi:hypothetical protein